MVNVNDIENIELYNKELEQQILGCILIENKVLRLIELELTEDSFYFDLHKLFFKEIKNLLQENRQADEQTIFYALNSKQIEYNDQELKSYIAEIINQAVSSLMTPKDLVKILNFLSLKRKLLMYNKEINEVLTSTSMKEIDEQIGNLEQKIYAITNDRRSQDNYSKLDKYTTLLMEKLKKARKSEKNILGVRTGIQDLDNYTGGLQKGDLIIIAARPSMGKTALATTIAKNIAEIIKKEENIPLKNGDEKPKQAVAFFSLEMSGEQLAARIVAMESKFNTKTIHTGRYDEKDNNGEVVNANKKINDAEWNKICQSMQYVSELPLYIDDTPALNISILRSRARYMKNRYNVCAIIIDYLQLLRPSKNVGGNRVLEIAEITSTLKAIAKELDVPVIALSQLSRAVEGNDRKDKRPQLSDLRESGTIEQDADIVMLLYRLEYYLSRSEPKITDEADMRQIEEHNKWLLKYEKVKDLAEIIVAKNRNGAVGNITLSFDREHMIFSGYEPNRNNLTINSSKTFPVSIPQEQNIPTIEKDENNSYTNDNDDIPEDIKDIFS